MTKFSRNIRYLRTKEMHTLKDVSEICGISLSTLCNYENEKLRPTGRTLEKLADFFGVTMDELWRGEMWKE